MSLPTRILLVNLQVNSHCVKGVIVFLNNSEQLERKTLKLDNFLLYPTVGLNSRFHLKS